MFQHIFICVYTSCLHYICRIRLALTARWLIWCFVICCFSSIRRYNSSDNVRALGIYDNKFKSRSVLSFVSYLLCQMMTDAPTKPATVRAVTTTVTATAQAGRPLSSPLTPSSSDTTAFCTPRYPAEQQLSRPVVSCSWVSGSLNRL